MSVPRIRTLLRQLRDRRVAQWTVAYLMGAWVFLEATTFVVREFGGAEWIVSTLTVALAFGTLSASTAAWFHGATGDQRLGGREVAIHAVILLSLLTVISTGPPLSGDAVGAGVEEAPPSITRVGVFYFSDHTAGRTLTSLASDLTEAVAHRLTQVPALDVPPLIAVDAHDHTPAAYDSLVAALRVGSLGRTWRPPGHTSTRWWPPAWPTAGRAGPGMEKCSWP